MPKKLVLSSIALHAAALAATIIAAIMYLARDFADTSISDLLDTYQIFLFGLVIGSVLYLADIVMLAKANNRDVISDAQTSALYASVVGDLCMAFCVFPLFINHPALALGIAAECLIVGNFALRMVCTVKLSHAVQKQPSEKKHSPPRCRTDRDAFSKGKTAFPCCRFHGTCLHRTRNRSPLRRIPHQNSFKRPIYGRRHSDRLGHFLFIEYIDNYFYYFLSRFLSFSLHFICAFQDGDEGTIFGHPRNHNYSLGHERTHDFLFLIYYFSPSARSRRSCHGRPALLG